VISEKQTHGRGRLDRKWVSPSGGIWLSLILHPEFEVSSSTLFPLITSLALAIAIEKILKIKPKLKWPNDVTINDKKVAGILVDASLESGKIDYLVVGVGINFKINPGGVEKMIKNTADYYGITTLVKKNENTNPRKLVQRFLLELEKLYQISLTKDPKYIIQEWTKRSSTIGKSISIKLPDEMLRGKALIIDDDGALVISNKGKTRRVIVGDIS